MLLRTIAVISFALGIASSAASADGTAEADYSNPQIWLCRPGRQDACRVPLDATVIGADGSMQREAYQPAKSPPIDCFYVYPTVSLQPTANSDLTVTEAERRVVAAQFARFGMRCRLFAPMYRQVTLSALIANIAGRPMNPDRELAYADVRAAWNYYLTHDNAGRGVVLVGHSQGSGVLTRLIKNEIDGKALQSRLVSAILMGTNLPVPSSRDVGGAFQRIALCRSNRQFGCAIAFADFRDTSPPPADSRFGRAADGLEAACTNPASLAGGPGELDAYLSARRISGGEDVLPGPFDWTEPPKPVDTPFVKVPGMLSAQCQINEHGSYLAVTVHANPGGARVSDISGDVVRRGKVQADWGLHLIDANLNMGNLLTVVGEETRAYLQANQKK